MNVRRILCETIPSFYFALSIDNYMIVDLKRKIIGGNVFQVFRKFVGFEPPKSVKGKGTAIMSPRLYTLLILKICPSAYFLRYSILLQMSFRTILQMLFFQ